MNIRKIYEDLYLARVNLQRLNESVFIIKKTPPDVLSNKKAHWKNEIDRFEALLVQDKVKRKKDKDQQEFNF